ncbi:hypothetical protein ACQKE8_19920 [Sphingobium limneticum]
MTGDIPNAITTAVIIITTNIGTMVGWVNRRQPEMLPIVRLDQPDRHLPS